MTRWRLIKDSPLTGHENMARDESILRAFEEGIESRPTLRLYGWSEPTVSIGYAQSEAPFAPFGVPVVRRITGGRAVLHQFELTYSVVAAVDAHPFAGGILEAYSAISAFLIDALREAGIEAEFSKGRPGRGENREACFHTPSRFEVLACGRKLVGSSQRRFKRAFLQHGSILFDVDRELTERIFGPEVIERMSRVSEFSSITGSALSDIISLKAAVRLGAEFLPGGLTPAEESIREGILSRNGRANPGAAMEKQIRR